MKYHTIEINDKEYNFRLTSSDAVNLEKKTGKSLLEVIGETSMKSTCLLLRYCRRGGGETNFSEEDSYDFYDELADNGFALEDIQTKILLPTFVVSGLLTKSDLDKIMAKVNQERATQE